jgi:hypothetical protein
MFILLASLATNVAGAATMLSVKLVKAEAGRCTTPPQLEFVTEKASWRVADKPHHNGENDWEVFFEIETDAAEPPLAEVSVIAPGVTTTRVIVGKTDVPFEQKGDRTRFRLVDDRSEGRLLEVVYRDPRGGYPIHFRHNWRMRRARQYTWDPYPEKQLAAIKNYLLAAHEVFRVMGDMGPGPKKNFRGDLCLMDTEVAASRGHQDYPAHVHIMFYQFEKNAEGKTEWVGRLVPHFYMDSEGRIVSNVHIVLAGRGKSGLYGIGKVCRFEDTLGNHVLDLIIEKEGLVLRRPDGEEYSLRPDPVVGAAKAVLGYRGETAICRASARDDPARGLLTFRIETIKDGKVIEVFEDGYRYDPFTGKVIEKTESESSEQGRD